MATNGVLNTNDFNGRYLSLSWELISQNPDNNLSVISWQLKGAGNSATPYFETDKIKVVINSVTVYASAEKIALYNNMVISSGTLTINHASDGTKTFNAYVEAAVGAAAVNCSGNAIFNLPPLNRYAAITSVSNFTDEQNPAVNFTNPNNAKLRFSIYANNAAVVVRDETNAQSPYLIEITETERNALRALIPNDNTLNVQFRLGTFSGDSIVYTNTADRVMEIVNASPTITGASYKDTNETTVSFSGDDQLIIQNLSTLQFTIAAAAAKKGAALVNVSATVNGETWITPLTGSTATNINILFGALDVSGDTNAEIVLTDSRGNTGAVSVPLSVAAWQAPTALISCARKNNFETATDLKANAVYSSVNGLNSVYINYQYKQTTAETWGALTPLNDGETATLSLNNANAYNIRVIVSDSLNGQTTYNLTVDRGTPIIFIDNKKRSVGFNCFPAANNSVEANGLILDDIKAVGAMPLYNFFEIIGQNATAILGAPETALIDGLFSNYKIPAGYVRAYRITAQVSTTGDNFGKVKLNNIESNAGGTYSTFDTLRVIISTRIFTESEITPEPVLNYPTLNNGFNLYAVNSAAGTAKFYNITLHGYLLKAETVLTIPQAADVDIGAERP